MKMETIKLFWLGKLIHQVVVSFFKGKKRNDRSFAQERRTERVLFPARNEEWNAFLKLEAQLNFKAVLGKMTHLGNPEFE